MEAYDISNTGDTNIVASMRRSLWTGVP
ncbi:MAG: hypothetical protein ACLSAF_19615 [Intestinimonas sp.]